MATIIEYIIWIACIGAIVGIVGIYNICKRLRLLREIIMSTEVEKYSMQAEKNVRIEFAKKYPHCYIVSVESLSSYTSRGSFSGYVTHSYRIIYVKK